MNVFTLWENDEYVIDTPKNPHIPFEESLQVIVYPKQNIAKAWDDPGLASRTFELATRACKIMEDLGVAPWFNLQANGNWGLLPGNTTFFHIHVYGRQKTENWGKPIVLPEAPGTYQNDPMPEETRNLLADAFKKGLEG